ncbi:MAG: metallophosphoesterase [Thermoanaerobaculia bacterium]|nr:metallophosphoesterase [Thermoanaerobaculia bacterium]
MLQRLLRPLLVALLVLPLAAQTPKPGTDGPHVLWDGPKAEVLWSREGRIIRTPLPPPYRLALEGLPEIRLRPEPPEAAEDDLPLPARVCVLSDLHGNWAGAVALLEAHGVLRSGLRWGFGKGNLVVAGDIMDRGEGQTELLWLLHGLEQQARKAGGRVHVLLGNHETMVMRGDQRYLNAKYTTAWAGLEGGVTALYGPRTELGRWLRSRAALLRLGDVLFVHGGFSPALLDREPTVASVNRAVRVELDVPEKLFHLGTDGPFWYRGLVPGAEKKRPDATAEDIVRGLAVFGVRRVVVGHTTMDAVTSLHGGKVLAVDAGLKDGKPGQVLRLEKGKPFRGLADGRLEPLE